MYVALEEGTYLYDPFPHTLVPAVAGDLRRLAIGRGQGGAGAEAAVRLIYVADIDKLVHTSGYQEPRLRDADVQRSYYYVDTGMIAANVYLFAACGERGRQQRRHPRGELVSEREIPSLGPGEGFDLEVTIEAGPGDHALDLVVDPEGCAEGAVRDNDGLHLIIASPQVR